MILLIIFVLILVFGIIMKKSNFFKNDYFLEYIADCIIALGVTFLVVSICHLVYCYSTIDSNVYSNKERYKTLVYQYENNVYENDNDLGKRDLIKDIQSWNEDLACNKSMQHNILVGIFIPDIYDQFDFIELK